VESAPDSAYVESNGRGAGFHAQFGVQAFTTWKKNPGGSLIQTDTIVVANSHSVITGRTFTDAIRVVEKTCRAELITPFTC
jgi:hypothetical protein